MSIASEITRLQGVKSDILQAISDKGVTVPVGSMLDECPELISRISGTNYKVIGGREYKTVLMPDGKEWLAENLDFKFCTVGTNSSNSYASAWYYDNDENTYGWSGFKSGLFYNWYAINVLNENSSELCPGWHIPSVAEWDALFTSIGGVSSSGTKMKATDDSISANYPSGWNGDNNYGFSVLPSGNRGGYYNQFVNFGTYTRFWKSPIEYNSNNGYFIQFSSSAPVTEGIDLKIDAYPVRLIRNP